MEWAFVNFGYYSYDLKFKDKLNNKSLLNTIKFLQNMIINANTY